MNSLEPDMEEVNQSTICDGCGHRSPKRWVFAFKTLKTKFPEEPSMTVKCIRCAVRHAPLLRRSSLVALVVGTILTILNQGDVVFSGIWDNTLYWKIPITYCVPFCVATYGALSNGRQ